MGCVTLSKTQYLKDNKEFCTNSGFSREHKHIGSFEASSEVCQQHREKFEESSAVLIVIPDRSEPYSPPLAHWDKVVIVPVGHPMQDESAQGETDD